MYYIEKNGQAVATSDPNEVTKENFLVEPGGENRVWVKLEQYEFDQLSGVRKTVRNQINAVNPGDFDNFAKRWKHEDLVMTLLHDPRPQLKGKGVEANLEQLNKKLKSKSDKNENENENGKTKGKTK